MSNVNTLLDDIAQTVYMAEQLQTRISELGAQISADYAGKNPVLIGVLRGVYVFMADLARTILAKQPGDEVTLTIKRDKKTLKIKVSLGERP